MSDKRRDTEIVIPHLAVDGYDHPTVKPPRSPSAHTSCKPLIAPPSPWKQLSPGCANDLLIDDSGNTSLMPDLTSKRFENVLILDSLYLCSKFQPAVIHSNSYPSQRCHRGLYCVLNDLGRLCAHRSTQESDRHEISTVLIESKPKLHGLDHSFR